VRVEVGTHVWEYGLHAQRPIPQPDPAVKTTLDIDDALLRRAKQVAIDRGTTLRAVVEEALARALGPSGAPVPIRTVVWPPTGSPAPTERTDWQAAIKRIRYGEAAEAPHARAAGVALPRSRRRR
jgi:hypothetical protein